jgi:hypothetical protein
MSLRLFLCGLALSILSGCANVQPVLGADSAADPGAGYVAGQFSKAKAANFAFVIRAADGGKEYMMSLGDDVSLPTAMKERTVAIKLPPGSYSVTQWVTYATLTKEIITRKDIGASVLTTPFTISPGSVTHLGSYQLLQSEQAFSYPNITVRYRIKPIPLLERTVREDFILAYPKLADQAFRCVLCIDTVRRPAP